MIKFEPYQHVSPKLHSFIEMHTLHLFDLTHCIHCQRHGLVSVVEIHLGERCWPLSSKLPLSDPAVTTW